MKCPACNNPLGIYDIIIEHASKHWHQSCLLDHLIEKADNPFAPIGGAGFHP